MMHSLCAKHSTEFQSKPLLSAYVEDIVCSLKESWHLWLDTYLHQ